MLMEYEELEGNKGIRIYYKKGDELLLDSIIKEISRDLGLLDKIKDIRRIIRNRKKQDSLETKTYEMKKGKYYSKRFISIEVAKDIDNTEEHSLEKRLNKSLERQGIKYSLEKRKQKRYLS
jgi:predicted transcriptional regulator